jgi:RNA polymerase sigma factor (sigma-70 family)
MTGSVSAEARFSYLMTEHGKAILGYLVRRTDPAHDAADLMAEVFVAAWRRVADVPSEPAEARAWLVGIARRVLANHRRGATRRNRLADRLRGDLELRVQSHGIPDAVSSRIDDALRRLDGDDRELLTLVVWEELTSEQAGAVLALSGAAVRKRLQRIRTRLRTDLEAGEESRLDHALS